MTEILLPQLGETVSEGTITRWFKQPGEAVAQDEPLYEVSTDKVDTEVPAPVAGVVSEILVPEGETVEVGTLLAQLEAADGAVSAGAAVSENGGEEAQESDVAEHGVADIAEEADDEAVGGDVSAVDEGGIGEPIAASPAAEAFETNSAGTQISDALADTTSAFSAKSDAAMSDDVAAEADLKRMSPVVRRLLHKNGIDPASITGTGPKGRITRKDAEAAVKKAGSASRAAGAAEKTATVSATGRVAPATIATTAADSASQASAKASSSPQGSQTQSSQPPPASSAAPPSSAHTEAIPLSRIRKATGDHMVRSKATSPHVLTAVEVDFEEVF